MTSRLRTPRLLLRSVEPGDAGVLAAHWNDPDVARYLWDGGAVSRSTVEAVVRHSEEQFATVGYGLWALCVPGRPEPVGACGLRALEGTGLVEVVYSLEPRQRGRGLATEAAMAVLRYGFSLGLERVVGGADAPNTASLRVLERLGMGFHDHLTVDGRVIPYYGVARDDFAAHHGQ